MDTLTPAQRHNVMSAIRSTGNSLETALRSQLFRFGFRFRKNDRRLAGSPDIVFPHFHAVVFVNGCFWHAHGWQPDGEGGGDSVAAQVACGKFHLPARNTEFWRNKFLRNIARDKRDVAALLEAGWRVGVVWECSITGKNRRQKIYDVAAAISLWLEEGFDEPFREF